MAITVSEFGSNGATTTATTIAVSGTGPAVGDILVVLFGRNDIASDTITDTVAVSGGGATTQLARHTFSSLGVAGTAADGCVGVAFVLRVTTAFATSTTITVTCPSTARRVLKVVRLQGNTVVPSEFNPKTNSGTTSTSALSIDNVNVAGACVIGCIVSEWRATSLGGDSDTLNGSWSAISTAAAGTAGSNADLSLGYQTKIVSSSGTQSFQATAGTSDWAQIGLVFREAPLWGSISDDFTGSSLSFPGWQGTFGTVTVSGNKVNLLTTDFSGANSEYNNLTGSSVFIKADTTASGQNAFDMRWNGDGNNCARIMRQGSTLYRAVYSAGSPVLFDTIAYDATAHAWWRIRESGGTIYLGVASSSGGSWTEVSATNPTAWDLTMTTVNLFADNTGSGSWSASKLNISSGVNHAGAATSAGSATATATGRAARPAGSTTAGTGTTALAVGRTARPGAATSTGSGTATPTSRVARPASATSSGSATAQATGRAAKRALSTSTGAATTSASGRTSLRGSVTDSGSGTTAATGRATKPASSTSTGTGTTSPSPGMRRPGAATSTGSATATATSRAARPATSTSAGTSITTPTAMASRPAAATTSGTSTASLVGRVLRRVAGTSTGAGTTSASGRTAKRAASTSTGVGTTSASATISGAGPTAIDNGTSTMTATARVAKAARATSTGVGTTVLTLGRATKRAAGTSAGSSSATATPRAYRPGASVTSGTAGATALGAVRRAAAAVSGGLASASAMLTRRAGAHASSDGSSTFEGDATVTSPPPVVTLLGPVSVDVVYSGVAGLVVLTEIRAEPLGAEVRLDIVDSPIEVDVINSTVKVG